MKEVKFILRDIDTDIVKAWNKYFQGVENVEISVGHILDLKADAIVSPANSFGYMDGGIDLVYSHHWGWQLEERLVALLKAEYDGELPVGQAVIIETGGEDIKYLISAPTMRIPMYVAGTVNAYLAFRAVIREVKRFNIEHENKILSLLCPGLGTATGRISPEVCAKQMREAYDICVLGRENSPKREGGPKVRHGWMTSIGD
jgi:O-acetyl-ADP-ribose deacetylase (regulator of RNase III)